MAKKTILVIVSENSQNGSTHIMRPAFWAARLFLYVCVGSCIGGAGSIAYFSAKNILLETENASLQKQHRDWAEKYAVLDEKYEIVQMTVDRIRPELEKIKDFVHISDPDRNIRPKVDLEERQLLLTSSANMPALVRGRMDMVAQDADAALKNAKASATYIGEQKTLLASVPSIKPTAIKYVTSGFGIRVDPFTGKRDEHDGVDYSANEGSDVNATSDGVVLFAGTLGSYGKLIMIDHNGNGFTTRYGHLSRITTVAGAKVQRGKKIGEVGSTGRSTGPHLHYEVRFRGIPWDPKRFTLD